MANTPFVQALGPYHGKDGTAATAAALAEISPRPPIIIPANLFDYIGKRLEYYAFGRITTAATPGTWTFGLYMGTSDTIAAGQAVVTTGALAAKASLTNATWRIEGHMECRAVGSTTAGQVMAVFETSNITSNGTDLAPATAPTVFGFDTGATNFIKLGITPSVATGSITCHYFGVRTVN